MNMKILRYNEEREWRVIPMETHNATMNMAIDEAVSNAVARGEVLPTMRFYRWQPSAVSIGYFQSLEDEVNLQVCKEMGVEFVRRRTGGGAVYHDYEGEVTYSVIGPENTFPKDITKSYHEICGWIIGGLGKMGIKAEFKPVNDIIAGGKKVSGNAQTRRGGVLLQHGTLLYDLDVRKMFSLLKVSREKISDKMIAAVEERVTCIKRQKDCTLEDTYKALLEGFTEGKKWSFGQLGEKELAEAKRLAETRYSSKEWNFRR